MKTAAYTKTPSGQGFIFNVTPAPKAIGGCAGILFILLIAFLAALIVSGMNGALAGVAFIGVALWGFLKMDLRKKSHRRPSTFTVYPDRIEVNGTQLPAENIHRIIIRNAYDKTPKIQLTGQPVSTGTGIGYDLRNILEQISFSVDAEAGGKATQLAGGLDEVTANGLLNEIDRVLVF